MEDEDGNFEIEVRDGCELRYHKGQLGNYVGVTERVGKSGKKSYQARLSITKHKGDKAATVPAGHLQVRGQSCNCNCGGQAQYIRPAHP